MGFPRKLVTIPVHCGTCGRPVTIQYVSTAAPATIINWTCPHRGCKGEHRLSLAGDYIDCWGGHGPDPRH